MGREMHISKVLAHAIEGIRAKEALVFHIASLMPWERCQARKQGAAAAAAEKAEDGYGMCVYLRNKFFADLVTALVFVGFARQIGSLESEAPAAPDEWHHPAALISETFSNWRHRAQAKF